MSTRGTVIAIVLAVALAAVAVSASATARAKIETKIIVLDAVAGHDDNLIITGRLSTANRRCRNERQLIVWVTLGDGTHPNDGRGVYDNDKSSNRGAWAMIVDTHTDIFGNPHETGATKIDVGVQRKVLGNGTVCKKALVDVPF